MENSNDPQATPSRASHTGNVGVGSPAPGNEDTPDPALEAAAAPLRAPASAPLPNDGPGREESGVMDETIAPTPGDQPHLPGQTQRQGEDDAQTHQ